MAKVIQQPDGEWVLVSNWYIDDVRELIDDAEIEGTFTDEDCLNILRLAADCHDANVGINWDFLHDMIDYYQDNKKEVA